MTETRDFTQAPMATRLGRVRGIIDEILNEAAFTGASPEAFDKVHELRVEAHAIIDSIYTTRAKEMSESAGRDDGLTMVAD